MAKKVVATLKKEGGGKNFAKIIKAVKSPKTGAYTFREEMVPLEEVQAALKGLVFLFYGTFKVPFVGLFCLYLCLLKTGK